MVVVYSTTQIHLLPAVFPRLTRERSWWWSATPVRFSESTLFYIPFLAIVMMRTAEMCETATSYQHSLRLT